MKLFKVHKTLKDNQNYKLLYISLNSEQQFFVHRHIANCLVDFYKTNLTLCKT